MDRKQFLSIVGLSSAAVFAGACLGGCKKNTITDITAPPAGTDISIDLSLPANASLLKAGGYIYSGGIIIAHTTSGGYIAVSQACTHEGVTVQYVDSQQLFYCPSHGATFSNTGSVISGPTSRSLKQYNTSLNGNILRVYA